MPTTMGHSVPPRLPHMFIAPLRTPARERPTSTHTGHAGATPAAPRPADSARSHAAAVAPVALAARNVTTAASGNPTAPGHRRPGGPKRAARRSLAHPPADTP